MVQLVADGSSTSRGRRERHQTDRENKHRSLEAKLLFWRQVARKDAGLAKIRASLTCTQIPWKLTIGNKTTFSASNIYIYIQIAGIFIYIYIYI